MYWFLPSCCLVNANVMAEMINENVMTLPGGMRYDMILS